MSVHAGIAPTPGAASRFSWLAFLVISAALVAVGVLYTLNVRPEAAPLPDLALVDQHRQAFRASELYDGVWVASFLPAGAPAEAVNALRALETELPPAVRLVTFTSGDDAAPGTAALPWHVAHGSVDVVRTLAVDHLGLASVEPGSLPAATLDRKGRVVGRYDLLASRTMGTRGRPALLADVDFLVGLEVRPLWHACLNGASGMMLLVGFAFIRKRRVTLHLVSMLLAAGLSIVFLGSYLYYHAHTGTMGFRGEGLARGIYLAILLTHTVLAAFAVPLVGTLLFHASRGQFAAHRKLARRTLPIWLYVSITGVVIYLMLYVWF